jgi:hypothetical protein
MIILVVAAFVAGYLIGRARPPAVMAMTNVNLEHAMTTEDGAAPLVAMPTIPDA